MNTDVEKLIEELAAVEQSGDDRVLWAKRYQILAALRRGVLAEKVVAAARRDFDIDCPCGICAALSTYDAAAREEA